MGNNMDWETHPLAFVAGIAIAAAFGSIASVLKEVNGTGIRWRRFTCRSIYRAANGIAVGLIASTITADLRIIWAAVIISCVAGVGEDVLLRMLPFRINEESKSDRQKH